MDLGKIKRCVTDIIASVDTIRHSKGNEFLIETTTACIETNLNTIVNEIVKQTKSKTYFETLKSNCEKFSDCKFCPLAEYKADFTKKCKGGYFNLNYSRFSPDELIDAYNHCKKYWEDMFND